MVRELSVASREKTMAYEAAGHADNHDVLQSIADAQRAGAPADKPKAKSKAKVATDTKESK